MKSRPILDMESIRCYPKNISQTKLQLIFRSYSQVLYYTLYGTRFYFIFSKSPMFCFQQIQFLKIDRVPVLFKTFCECQGNKTQKDTLHTFC